MQRRRQQAPKRKHQLSQPGKLLLKRRLASRSTEELRRNEIVMNED